MSHHKLEYHNYPFLRWKNWPLISISQFGYFPVAQNTKREEGDKLGHCGHTNWVNWVGIINFFYQRYQTSPLHPTKTKGPIV